MQVVIHAGVAFTDDGLLARSLQANRAALQERRTLLLGPRHCRQFVKVMSDTLADNAAPPDARRDLQSILPKGSDAQRVLVSSEKFFGPRRTAIQDGQLYPLAGQRTAYTERLLEGVQIELFFGLMNPAIFIPKILLSLRNELRRTILKSIDLSCLSWLSMLEDLRDLAPGIRLTLWEHEDTPLIWGDIMRAMSGLPEDTAMQDEHALLASLLTEVGKRELVVVNQHRTSQDDGAVRAEIRRIFEHHAEPDKIEVELDFPGWNADVISAFSELYAQDLDRIQTMQGVRVLRP